MTSRMFRVALLCLSLLYASSCSSSTPAADEQPAEQLVGDSSAPAGAAGREALTDSDIVPVGDSPILGKPSAPITVVAFSDLQCPYCVRAAKTLHQLQEKYPEDVRVVFKHYPLPFHQQAEEAAKAAIAAGNQGKFWQMHDWLFERQQEFKSHDADMKEWTAGYAKELGLDVARFKDDFDAYATQQVISEDVVLGQRVKVRGTPHFFINGERMRGALPLPAFEEVVKRQISEAEALQQEGVARADIYEKMVETHYSDTIERPKPSKPDKPTTRVAYVPVDLDDPVRGDANDPLVTIVEFSDFQCPFCAKVTPTLEKIVDEYPEKVRVVFKQLPLGMHQQARPAAKAALAAHEQGKFWEMHDKLFEKQREMRRHDDDFKAWSAGLAKELGLDVAKFEKDFDSAAIAKAIDDDVALSQKVGARGTPNFWINGVNLRGAQPYSKFKAEIDRQIAVAQKIEKEDEVAGDALYKMAVEANKKAYADNPNGPPPPKPAAKVDTDKLQIGGAPVLGPKDAPVTIVVFSDFQCPFCRRGAENLFEVMEKYPGEIKLVFKHFPLPFHAQAKTAARAAMAAGEQGKFWEMHDRLFEEQRRFRTEEGIFKELAQELGLNVEKFEKDMQRAEYDEIIEEDMKQGQAVGVRGTPAFFVNGSRIVGSQPPARFEEEIEEALEEAK